MFQKTKIQPILKKLLFIAIAFSWAVTVSAQGNRGFDAAKFESQLEQYITTEAGLTPQEASSFFPVYREMKRKQYALMSSERRNRFVSVDDDKACAEAIKKHDENDIAIKELIRDYHQKFLKILPANKVFKIIRAEDRYHRQALKRVARKDRSR